jgi:hypothetical protein
VGEKDFERELSDRLIRLEIKMDIVLAQCPPCQARVQAHDIALAKVDESAKSAHKRIDNVYRTAGYISAGVGFALQVIAFIIQRGGH